MIVQADAVTMPLADESVDLIVTSPPYFALRSYRDGDEHYAGQIGSEPTPQAFLEALWAVTAEMVRVLKPSGSIWVNLGDKYAGSGGHNNAGISDKSTLRGNGHVGGVGKAGPQKVKATLRNAPDRYNQNATFEAERRGIGEKAHREDAGLRRLTSEQAGVPAKSLMGLPWRYAIGCIDRLGLILRAEVVWSKPNGLPESVTDRVRRSHEQWFHFTKQGRYFSAVDEVREGYADTRQADTGRTWEERKAAGERSGNREAGSFSLTGHAGTLGVANPLGKLPGSVWTVPAEPLITPGWRVVRAGRTENWFFDEAEAFGYMRNVGVRRGRPSIRSEVPHFAGFAQELPRRIILGWSPSGVCVECGEGRRPVVAKTLRAEDRGQIGSRGEKYDPVDRVSPTVKVRPVPAYGSSEAAITGYACACGTPAPPTKPAVVLDPFAGTGTTIGVARALGRTGIGLDLSHDYARLARWRVEKSGHFAKTAQRTHRDNQGDLFGATA